MDGHEVFILTRSPGKTHLPAEAVVIGWDGRTSSGWGERMNDMDAVVNLVGERLSKWPWTTHQRNRFMESRVNGGRALTEAIRKANKRPRALIQASGINYYGPQEGSNPVTEAAPRGNDFLADLCKKWEEATQPVEELGVRRVIIRSAIVLNSHDGILPIMMLPDRFFIGGRLGNGKQGLSWIHQKDEVAAIRFLLENEAVSGPYNLSAPIPVSSTEFLRTLARVMKRPYWLPVPGWALRLALGGMATLVLDGMYALPKRLEEQGFHFQFREAETALRDVCKD
jgi:uncharacterized protein (TIGR01777 family)